MGVAELVRRIGLTLAEGFPGRFWVEGELSGFRPKPTGHVFFTLKETGAQVEAVMWSSARASLRFEPEDGMQILARVSKVDFYAAHGRLRVHIDTFEPAGAGALAAALEQRRRRLQAEGLFDDARKRPLPFLPRVVGVATAETGAAIRDIVATLERRFPGVRILLRPCLVQGEGAPADIAAALADLNREGSCEVLIVGRGGGSAEDLMAFNEEIVVRAIVASRIPVVSAVGHESDTTLADHAADRRAATPTAAAELVVPVRRELEQRIADFGRRLSQAAKRRHTESTVRIETLRHRLGDPRVLVRERRSRVQSQTHRALAALHRLTPDQRARLDQLSHRALGVLRLATPERRRRVDALSTALKRRAPDAAALRWQTERLGERAVARMTARMEQERHALAAAAGRLDAFSPLAVLERGYALARDAKGRLVRDAAALEVGARLELRFARGAATVEVVEPRPAGDGKPGEV